MVGTWIIWLRHCDFYWTADFGVDRVFSLFKSYIWFHVGLPSFTFIGRYWICFLYSLFPSLWRFNIWFKFSSNPTWIYRFSPSWIEFYFAGMLLNWFSKLLLWVRCFLRCWQLFKSILSLFSIIRGLIEVWHCFNVVFFQFKLFSFLLGSIFCSEIDLFSFKFYPAFIVYSNIFQILKNLVGFVSSMKKKTFSCSSNFHLFSFVLPKRLGKPFTSRFCKFSLIFLLLIFNCFSFLLSECLNSNRIWLFFVFFVSWVSLIPLR